MLKGFLEFIKEYKVIGLAIGIIIGLASTQLVNSLVSNIVMPLITPFIPNGAWKEAVFILGPIVLKWGAFIGDLINFLVIAFVVYLVAKVILREEKVSKK